MVLVGSVARAYDLKTSFACAMSPAKRALFLLSPDSVMAAQWLNEATICKAAHVQRNYVHISNVVFKTLNVSQSHRDKD